MNGDYPNRAAYQRAIRIAGAEIEKLARSIELRQSRGEDTAAEERRLDELLQAQAQRIAALAKGR